MALLTTPLLLSLTEPVADGYAAAEAEIESLDRAIGDGDHFQNLKRGSRAVADQAHEWQGLSVGQALSRIGMTLMSTIGGASGPLLGSLFMAMGKAPGADAPQDLATIAAMFRSGVDAVAARGKSARGQKTMLDVLYPVADALDDLAARAADPATVATALRRVADQAARATADLPATKGRASSLGERALGHVDPGARSCALILGLLLDRIVPSSSATDASSADASSAA